MRETVTDNIDSLLRAVRGRRMSIAQAAKALRAGHLPGGKQARLDFRRAERTGLPEIILSEGKSPEDLRDIVQALARAGLGAVISRVSGENHRLLRSLAAEGLPLRFNPRGHIVVLEGKGEGDLRGRPVAVLSAGTADIRVAEEAATVLDVLGAEVFRAYDVGVAGLHRLIAVLKEREAREAQLFIVCAGREGTLPTVVAGLVDRPVIGVPTSVGYGKGGKGEAALTSMLQSCAPLAVVNVDGGVPAALVAAQFLRHLPAPQARRRTRKHAVTPVEKTA